MKILIALFCLIGIGLPIWMGVISIGALAWNDAPYLVFAIILFFRTNNLAIFTCVLLMLIVDLLFYTIMKVDSHSSYLLALSLISTLKIFLLLPVGIIFYFLKNRTTDK